MIGKGRIGEVWNLPTPRTGLLIPLKNSSTASAEEFCYNLYYNEGLENKLTRAPLLGLAKSIYYHVHPVFFQFKWHGSYQSYYLNPQKRGLFH